MDVGTSLIVKDWELVKDWEVIKEREGEAKLKRIRLTQCGFTSILEYCPFRSHYVSLPLHNLTVCSLVLNCSEVQFSAVWVAICIMQNINPVTECWQLNKLTVETGQNERRRKRVDGGQDRRRMRRVEVG